jgi:hypothetical protein
VLQDGSSSRLRWIRVSLLMGKVTLGRSQKAQKRTFAAERSSVGKPIRRMPNRTTTCLDATLFPSSISINPSQLFLPSSSSSSSSSSPTSHVALTNLPFDHLISLVSLVSQTQDPPHKFTSSVKYGRNSSGVTSHLSVREWYLSATFCKGARRREAIIMPDAPARA